MTLETTFYLLGIIFMSMMIIATIGMVVLAFYIKSKIEQFEQDLKEKFKQVTAPATFMAGLGSYFLGRFGRMFKR